MVYAVKLGNNLKIGYSGNIRNRLNSFKTTNPDLILLALKHGTHLEERRLHYIFKEYLIHGEVFKLTEDSLNLLRNEFKECFDLLPNISLDTLDLLCDHNYQEYLINRLEKDLINSKDHISCKQKKKKKEETNSISYIKIPHSMVNSRINYLAVGIYAILKYYMNETTKSCFPSYKTLSDKTGLSTPTLKKYIDLLEDEGYLKRINRGFKNSNLYTFNIRDLYIEDSEMFSFDFLNNEKLDFKSKSAYIVLQEYMSKNEHLGELCDTNINICKYLGVSYDTWKKLCETFLNNWNMTKTNAKDPESKDNKYLYTFDLETIGQAVLFNRKKIEEHDEMLHEMREEINNLTHELKILQKQVNVQNQEEIKSNCKLKVI
jgi:DNA-binding Lrp family transcriptional regulator